MNRIVSVTPLAMLLGMVSSCMLHFKGSICLHLLFYQLWYFCLPSYFCYIGTFSAGIGRIGSFWNRSVQYISNTVSHSRVWYRYRFNSSILVDRLEQCKHKLVLVHLRAEDSHRRSPGGSIYIQPRMNAVLHSMGTLVPVTGFQVDAHTLLFETKSKCLLRIVNVSSYQSF